MALVLDPIAALGVVGNWPPVEPVSTTFPLVSMASAVALSAVGPPSSVPQIWLPEGSTFITDASGHDAGMVPPPKPGMEHVPPPCWVCAAPARIPGRRPELRPGWHRS